MPPRVHLKRIIVTFTICATFIIYITHNSNRSLSSTNNIQSESNAIKYLINKPNIATETVNPSNIHIESDRKDWHNYIQINHELNRTGPGENGKPLILHEFDKNKEKELLNVNGFNALVSDQISVNRSINDLRHKDCQKKTYSNKLPQASIIIPFHDEHWSTLLRTIYSLLNRAPEELVKEMILVDDDSSKEFLHKPLELYLKEHFPTKVKLLRTKQREGLIRARLIGAKSAESEVLIFIDSHCEAGINWLPPLLDPIKDNYRIVTCPFIEVIREDNFAIIPQDDGARGAFDWNMDYKRLPRLSSDDDHPSDPFDSPVMAGGLFAISAKWFWELGGYDTGLEVWGGEQYELSFKLWMCGGKMIDIPCSRIGHVYRKFNPFGVPGKGDYVAKNHKRVAEVWMDNWKNYVYRKHFERYQNLETGNLTSQIQLRQQLKCKSFDWFMKEVAFDLLQHYPAEDPVKLAHGNIHLESHPELCLDSKFGKSGDSVKLDYCLTHTNQSQTQVINGEQNFEFTWHKDIRPHGRDLCLDYSGGEAGRTLMIYTCHNMKGNQYWKYDPNNHRLLHIVSRKCLDSIPKRKEVFLSICSSDSSQKWILDNLNQTEVAKEWANEL